MKSISALIVFLFALICEPCFSQDIARVRNEVEVESPPWVGQRVPFHIDLMSASFFSGTAHFDLPDIPGVILMKVKGSPTVTSESVDDATWSVQRHQFMAYAHRAGQIQIPPFDVRFSVSEGFGKPKKPQRIKTTLMKFESNLPPGAEGYSLLVSTSELKATEDWSVKPNEDRIVELFVGDAISREISLEAKDIPAMALPEIPFPELNGLTRYPGSPVLNDKEYRGSLTGQRTGAVTYICEREGEYEIPGLIITWWDTEKKKLEKESFPGISLRVKVDPNRVVEKNKDLGSEQVQGQGTAWTITAVIALLGTAFVVYLGWRFIEKRVLKVSGGGNKLSESRLFLNVIEACAANRPARAYEALMTWIECTVEGTNAPTLSGYARIRDNDAKLQQQFDLLQQAVIGRSTSWRGEELAAALQELRGRRLRRSERKRKAVLPALNPGKSSSVAIQARSTSE